MAASYVRRPGLAVLVAGLWLLTLGAGGRADEKDKEDPLRAELLKLNSAGTEEVQTARLRAIVKDREKAKKMVAEAHKMMQEAKDGEKPFNLNGTAILARAAHVVKQYDAAEKLYEHQVELATKLKSGPKMLTAYDNLIDLYFDQKKYQEAIDRCEAIVDMRGPKEIDDAKPFILEKIIQATAKQGKVDEALNMTKNILQATDNSWYFLRLKGLIEREGGKTDAAIATFTEVLDKLDAAKEVKGDAKDKLKDGIRYTLSGLYVENKDIDKAAKQLQTLIKRNPDKATYKNDLGFIWCDHDMNLEESEKLIREALELDKKEQEKLKADGKIDEIKENAAYLDSLGWVLFKQKKYKEALEPLKKASKDEEEGGHLEIWDHLADCYMALGQKKEAVAAWEKALKMEDISKRDGERRRKVSEKLKKTRAELSKD
jgi:tetratricopeptide (TPR) repeat protein